MSERCALTWECAPAPPGGDLDGTRQLDWIPAAVPGTAAAAVRDVAGWQAAVDRDFDAEDWWYRARFGRPEGRRWVLELDGLATVSEVWLNGEPVLTSASMFQRHRVPVPELAASNELVVCLRALNPLLRDGRPRARWRTRLVARPGLRRFRTAYVGRMPSWFGLAAPVGPWREIRLVDDDTWRVVDQRIRTALTEDGEGVVSVEATIAAPSTGPEPVHRDAEAQPVLTVRGGGVHETTTATADIIAVDSAGGSPRLVVRGEVAVRRPARWWPHTHGDQPLFDVSLQVLGHELSLGRTGFRAIEAVRDDGGFALRVNGCDVFVRGACWVPPDPLALGAADTDVRADLTRLRSAGFNLVRITGTWVWESEAFWDACDELGLLVWQDCMLGPLDPPQDGEFEDLLAAEVTTELGRLTARPSLSVVSGGSETEQQPTYAGLDGEGRYVRAVRDVIPAVVADVLPRVPYVTSSPSGGDLPTHDGSGVAHYFGVGAYLRPLTDARRAAVRFAAECLAFATPPDADAVEEWFGSPAVAGHDPRWKRAVPRDSAASWDFEDVTAFYVREVFGVDPLTTRVGDPLLWLDLCRAAVAHAMAETFTEWRRPGSGCGGGIVLQSRDLAPGAGWGLLDAAGRPKAPWHVLRRILAPRAVLITDEGLDGLAVHVVNDAAEALAGTLVVELVDRRGRVQPHAERAISLSAHSAGTWSVDGLLGRFHDVTNAHRFGPPTLDAVRVQLRTNPADVEAQAVWLRDHQHHPARPTIGLSATARPERDGWAIDVGADELARWVSIEAPGFDVGDNWFHLLPGERRTVPLRCCLPAGGEPRGVVRALNALDAVPIRIDRA